LRFEPRIGTSGWNYAHWRERFYERGLPASRWLERYAREFDTVELNASFYRLPAAESYDRWRATTPEEFVFAVKASRFITHMKRLLDPEKPLSVFLERATRLREKLGPVLFQLPPNMKRDDDRLARFLDALPGGLQSVFEFRDPRWHVPAVYDLLRRHEAALCVMVHPKLKRELVATAPLVYVRFHAPEQGYLFGRRRLGWWAGAIRELAAERRAWIYFNNDQEGAAIEDARTLLDLMRRKRRAA
jgi:uncharacterized protein YecE (DUF72 family)